LVSIGDTWQVLSGFELGIPRLLEKIGEDGMMSWCIVLGCVRVMTGDILSWVGLDFTLSLRVGDSGTVMISVLWFSGFESICLELMEVLARVNSSNKVFFRDIGEAS